MHSSSVRIRPATGSVGAAGAAWASARPGRPATRRNARIGRRRIVIRILLESIRWSTRITRGTGRVRDRQLLGSEHALGEELEHARGGVNGGADMPIVYPRPRLLRRTPSHPPPR